MEMSILTVPEIVALGAQLPGFLPYVNLTQL
jgi:hypothetical protein